MRIIQNQLGAQAKTRIISPNSLTTNSRPRVFGPNTTPCRTIFSSLPRYRRFTLPSPITGLDLVLLKCANVAIDFTTANVGGAKTGTVIHGVLFGEVFFTLSANQFGPDTRSEEHTS